MHNVREIAQRVLSPIDIARHGIVGLFGKALAGRDIPTKQGIANYMIDGFYLAEWGAEEAIGILDATLTELVRSERERAYADMRVARSEAHTARSPSLSVLHDRVSAEMRLFAAEGGRLLSQYAANATLFVIAGSSPQVGALMASNNMSAKQRRWMDGRVGAGHAVTHRIYLAVCETLQQARINAYLTTASQLGAEVFELTELGRTPRYFTIENVPADRLHPQSTAVIKVAR